MVDVPNTPSYKSLHFSDYFKKSPTVVVPVGLEESAAPIIPTTYVSTKYDEKSMCAKLLAGLLVVIMIYLAIKYVPRMFTGMCGGGVRSARAATVTPAGEPHVVKSGNELKNMISSLGDDESIVVMFHAPWCGHCKASMPAFKSACKNSTCGTKFVTADCHNDLSPSDINEYSIQGFPTFKKFTKTDSHEHKGSRSEKSLSDFACSK